MSASHEEFTKLRRLLRWKRYEQPPPGQLDHLRRRIISRLEADELIEYSSWWRWLIEKFDAKPVLVCVYGVVVSGLLLAGFRLSQVFEGDVAATPVFSGPWLAVTPGSGAAVPEDWEQGSAGEVHFTSFNTLSKHARFGFGGDAPPILLNDRGGLRFSPIAPALSEH